MNFDLSDEQLLLQDTVDQFLSSECPPARLRELFDADDAFDPVLEKGMAELHQKKVEHGFDAAAFEGSRFVRLRRLRDRMHLLGSRT